MILVSPRFEPALAALLLRESLREVHTVNPLIAFAHEHATVPNVMVLDPILFTTRVEGPSGHEGTMGRAGYELSYDSTGWPDRIKVSYATGFFYCRDERDEGTDPKRWRRYWQKYLVARQTPYHALKGTSCQKVVPPCKIPGLAESRKTRLSPARHAHRKFVARMMRPVKP